MRRFVPPVSTRSAVKRLVSATVLALVAAFATISAQIPGRNVNMVSGVRLPDGDPFLQRQNEPSIAASTRNPLHLLGGSNDYRTVDIPNPVDGGVETGDAWLGLYKSLDGGQRWISTLLPGYPQEAPDAGLDVHGNKSPLHLANYKAAADPVVRAGTSGMFYYSGLAFDRGENGKSTIFMARFIDNNNREDRDAIVYLGTSLIASSTGSDGRFLDKPWLAVDIPRGSPAPTCSIETPGERNVDGNGNVTQEPNVVQTIQAGTLYVAYTSFFGPADNRQSEILLTRSFDCGVTWQPPMLVSRPEDPVNQGATLAVDPASGHVYVAWRRFTQPGTTVTLDAMMLARLPHGGNKFDPPGVARRFPNGKKVGLEPERFRAKDVTVVEDLTEFDQGTGSFQFRTNAYPSIAIDDNGRVYMAWSERGFATLRSDPISGDARIVMVTTTNGSTFTEAVAIDNSPAQNSSTDLVGHQVMPSVAFSGGKLMVIYYDLRETKAEVFGPRITDAGLTVRNTIDIRAAMGSPGAPPVFQPSVKVSEYLVGFHSVLGPGRRQLQFNPPNLPMFKQGTVPFIGDYIDIAPSPNFVIGQNGRWQFNSAATPALPTFHAVWTDNRDVRRPADNDWTNYGPPQSALTNQTCVPGNAGSRNQNIYTARLTGGLLVGSPGNTKPLSADLQRSFVVFANNVTTATRAFRMTILNQPAGGRASFDQFPVPPYSAASPAPRLTIDMLVPPRSTAARTVYVTSSDAAASIGIDISEISAVGGPEVDGGLEGLVVLNPDIENPDIENPDIENPDIENPDIENAEVATPDIENPDIENPDIENPDIENPDIENPDIENPDIENPDIENILIANPDIENPDIENPDIENPDIENPDIENPDIENVAVGGNGVLTDVTWNVSNTGNTTSAFNINLFLASTTVPTGYKTQLILHKTYRTPIVKPGSCTLAYESRNIVLANIPRPEFITPDELGVPDQNDPSDKNATLWLGPGEIGKVTLRVYDPLKSDNVIVINSNGEPVSVDPAFNPHTAVTLAVSSQAVATVAIAEGYTDPPLVTPTGSNLFFLQMPTDVLVGAAMMPSVAVQVRDNLTGTPVPAAQVTLTLGSNLGQATLSGNSATSNANGIAIFPSLAVNTVGTGYSLIASATTAGVVATAHSVPFNVTDLQIAMPTVGERAARSGVAYALTLSAVGGSTPYQWSLVGGALPPGLSLNTDTGTISGISMVPGAHTFTVRVQDAQGMFDTLTICITVLQPLVTDVTTTAVGAGVTLVDLVTTLLGQGVTVSNITLNGQPASDVQYAGAGVFDRAGSVLGIDRGIILSSGSVSGAPGPNDSDGTTGFLGTAGDADLTTLARQSSSNPDVETHDATVLEFDFVPAGGQVSFRYVFGSEEYNEFVASQYNDAFGFYITGPDNIKRNFAVVPGTQQPVTINTINNGNPGGLLTPSNPHLYRNNDLNDGGGSINIEADGLTVVLTLTADVVAGQTHRMKLAIADAGDSSLDSWVFLEGGSFSSAENCTNGIDDDGDGLADGMDPDCQVCPEIVPGELIVTVPATAGGLANQNSAPSGTAPIAVVTLLPNQAVSVSATGTITYFAGSPAVTADGTGAAADASALAPTHPALGLVARIAGGVWQFVGVGPIVLDGGPAGGLLELAVNDSTYDDNAGAFAVTIRPQ